MPRDINKRRESQRKANEKFNRNHPGKQIEYNAKRKLNIRTWLNEYKATLGCSTCTENHPACLQFHHTNNDKLFSIGNAINGGYSKEKILLEINKCVVLCANCHLKLHYIAGGR